MVVHFCRKITRKALAATTALSGSKHGTRAALILIAALFVATRISLLPVSLERDEGEYAFMASQFLDGHAPFSNAYNMKLPGVALTYAAFFAIAGKTIEAAHLALLFVDILTLGFFYLILVRLGIRSHIRLPALFFLALLLTGWRSLGFAAHATHFILGFFMPGLWLMLFRGSTWKLAASGLLMGFAFLCKQQAVFLLATSGLALIVLSWKNSRSLVSVIRECCVFGFSALVPLAVIIAWAFAAGSIETMKFWTVDYANAYTSLTSLQDAVITFSSGIGRVAGDNLPLWLIAIPGLFFILRSLRREKDGTGAILFVLGVGAFLTVVPGYYFRPHYFVTMLPFVALCGAWGVSSVATMFAKAAKTLHVPFIAALALSAVFVVYPVAYTVNYCFLYTNEQLHARAYGTHLFVSSVSMAEKIRELTPRHDSVGNLTCDPQIMFYADRRSASGYLYMYSLMEDHKYAESMQRELIQEIESNRPATLVYIPRPWDRTPKSRELVFTWLEGYLTNYCLEHIFEVNRFATHLYHPLITPLSSVSNRHAVWGFVFAKKQPPRKGKNI